jgi:hypothetical protein
MRKPRNPKWAYPTATPTYYAWRNMMSRCYNPKNASYLWYGARGVGVCPRWHSFDAFIEDMGERPDSLTLDRVDNTKGYGPDNCAWRSMRDNLNNRGCTVLVGGTPVTRVADAIGAKADTLRKRISRGNALPEVLKVGRLNAPKPVPHGTRLRYERDGCRCDACRAYNTARHRAFIEKKIHEK